VELTTTLPLLPGQTQQDRQLWRSNADRISPFHKHVAWVKLVVPWEELRAQLGNGDDPDHRVKHTKNVTLPSLHVDMVVDVVHSAVDVWSRRAGSREMLKDC
jgi:hypothetical protein